MNPNDIGRSGKPRYYAIGLHEDGVSRTDITDPVSLNGLSVQHQEGPAMTDEQFQIASMRFQIASLEKSNNRMSIAMLILAASMFIHIIGEIVL